MLGFAVVDAPGDDAPVVVWLVSRVSGSEAATTNAVVWSREDLADEAGWARLRGMLADRYVTLTSGSGREVLSRVLGGESIPTVDVDQLREAVRADVAQAKERFAAEGARRRAAKQPRLVAPAWPEVPVALDRDGRVEGDLPPQVVRPALWLAREVQRVWTAWLKLEVLRSARPYLADPTDLADPSGLAGESGASGEGVASGVLGSGASAARGVPRSFAAEYEVVGLRPSTR